MGKLDEAYDALKKILTDEGHGEDCAYRCLDDSGRCDHSCEVCAEKDEEVPSATADHE